MFQLHCRASRTSQAGKRELSIDIVFGTMKMDNAPHSKVAGPPKGELHPFGGCDRLLRQYKIVGQELERLSRTLRVFNPAFSSVPEGEGLKHFQQSLSFIPTEVLDSYRSDLLDPQIRSERLFIKADRHLWRLPLLAFSGMIGAIALGLHAASSGASFFLSFGVTLLIAAPFAAIWHLAPRDGTLRRLRFAQWLAEEIHRRNGDDGGARERKQTSILSPLWAGGRHPNPEGAFSFIGSDSIPIERLH